MSYQILDKLESSADITLSDVKVLRKYAAASELAYIKVGWDEYEEFKTNFDNHSGFAYELIPIYKDGGNHASATDSLGGYIISSEHELIVAFRGTEKTPHYWKEWLNDFNSHPTKRQFGDDINGNNKPFSVLIHEGVNAEYDRLRMDFLSKLSKISLDTKKSIVLCGHSLGGMCQIAALDILTYASSINPVFSVSESLTIDENSHVIKDDSSNIKQSVFSSITPENIKIFTYGAFKIFSAQTYGSKIYHKLIGNSYISTDNAVSIPQNPHTLFKSLNITHIRVRFGCDPVPHYPMCRRSYGHTNNVDIILMNRSVFVDHAIKSYRVFLNSYEATSISAINNLNSNSKMKIIKLGQP